VRGALNGRVKKKKSYRTEKYAEDYLRTGFFLPIPAPLGKKNPGPIWRSLIKKNPAPNHRNGGSLRAE
jgi:hypothetical protein